jgi:hypothetical protein
MRDIGDSLVMHSTLVFLHIPKSAGTSQRMYLANVYGEENMYWYGLDSDAKKFDAEQIASARVVGGHRGLDFYPQSLDALYLSIVRDPVERAISFFNYCTAPLIGTSPKWRVEHEKWLEKWRKQKGMCHYSMSRSIENCKEFRKQITNFQCGYLSRHGASYEGVRKTLEKEHMVIGLFDQMAQFNKFLQIQLMFEVENRVQANTGSAGYSAAILEEERLTDLIEELNEEDQALYDFISSECDGLYAKSTKFNDIRGRVPVVVKGSHFGQPLGQFDWSKVHLYSKGIVGLVPGKAATVPIVINNRSSSAIVFSETEDRICAIGWQFQNESGVDIAGAMGMSKTKATIHAEELRLLNIDIDMDYSQFLKEAPRYIVFFIVDNDCWVREKYPFSSSWAIIA